MKPIFLAAAICATAAGVVMSCKYDPSFKDCTIACSTSDSAGCPSGLSCLNGLCSSGTACADAGNAGSDAGNTQCGPGPIGSEGSSGSATGSGSNTLTWMHTTGATASLLIVGVSIEKQSTAMISAISYAGQPMTRAGSVGTGSGVVKAEIWSLGAPATGQNPVVVTFTAPLTGDGAAAGAISLSGVAQNVPIRMSAVGSGDGQPSTSVTTHCQGSWVIDTLTVDNVKEAASVGSGQTQQWNVISGTFGSSVGITGAGSTKATTTPGPMTMSWSLGSGDNWAQVAVEVAP